MAGLTTFSDLLGYTSIACWLGAQFPQVFENIRLQSCEGLALPFLANWFLGDLSNLIGCLLTHQLPFQTWLATYFVFVDFMLLTQYFYYRRSKPPTFPRTRSRAASTTIGRVSSDRIVPRYRTLSTVAANVAAAAALAAQQEEAEPRYSHARWHTTGEAFPARSGSHVSRDTAGDDEDVDESALAALADSFHSEGGRDSRRMRVSWSTERHARRGGSVGRSPTLTRAARLPTPGTALEALGHAEAIPRGRSLQRDSDAEEAPPESPSVNRRSSRASRRGAGMVFLGAWALFGVGTLAGGRLPAGRGGSVGRILVPGMVPAASVSLLARQFNSPPLPSANPDYVSVIFEDRPPPGGPNDPPPSHSEPSTERILGRVFAWLCTTLYLTSRLPQIWKNFVRKSVEGLSMYLFIFAFLGNTFYVASILTSPNVYQPPPISTDFIKESIPYLLGSGGTLMFDITIVTQSFIYRPRHRKLATRGRNLDEEETGLLTADILAQPQHDSAEDEAARKTTGASEAAY